MTASRPSETSNFQEEICRLSTNWQSLLDAMPEMVLLLNSRGEVQYMNRSATSCFGASASSRVAEDIRGVGLRCLLAGRVGNTGGQSPANSLVEAEIASMAVEYSCVPFVGYTGEDLTMLIMRDTSLRKAHERELHQFNTNIEDILARKIAELQSSEEMRLELLRQVNSLKNQLGHYHKADKMIGSSRKMRELREMIHQVAGSDATILITGESGTGKELVANLVKALSPRDGNTFLKINCNAINDSILESDLFGYEKGAFTGADGRKIGKFEVVNRGTIFLDEIGDISPRMQAALLRVLQNGEIVRVGGTEPVKIDVRVIAATNVDLAEAVKAKNFRLDLFYRLNIINIDIPPLRERKEDIVELVSHFVQHYRLAFKKEIDFVPQSVINRLLQHDWPGNVRELENLIQRAVLMAKGKMITEKELLFDQGCSASNPRQDGLKIDEKLGVMPLKDIMVELENEIVLHSLRKHDGNVNKVAEELQVGKTALYDKMKRSGISAKSLKRG